MGSENLQSKKTKFKPLRRRTTTSENKMGACDYGAVGVLCSGVILKNKVKRLSGEYLIVIYSKLLDRQYK